mmetsp:Transcript_6358/g.7147  ORF Transcript_6358/g.7147 Transcript_6358/m.7147 type:complete len:527 (-) Transcript_6358:86-1666(-)
MSHQTMTTGKNPMGRDYLLHRRGERPNKNDNDEMNNYRSSYERSNKKNDESSWENHHHHQQQYRDDIYYKGRRRSRSGLPDSTSTTGATATATSIASKKNEDCDKRRRPPNDYGYDGKKIEEQKSLHDGVDGRFRRDSYKGEERREYRYQRYYPGEQRQRHHCRSRSPPPFIRDRNDGDRALRVRQQNKKSKSISNSISSSKSDFYKDYTDKRSCSKNKQNHDIICIDEFSDNDDDSSNLIEEHTEAKAPINHDIICIDEDSDDDDVSTNSTKEQTESKRAKLPINQDIIYIDGDTDDDDDFFNSKKEQVRSKKSKALTSTVASTLASTKMTTATNTETTTTTNTKFTQNNEEEGLIWDRLNRILNNKKCRDEPAGPSQEENRLLSRVTEFGITPYKFEVPLGNGVSDCVGHDMNSRLCVVEAKCISMKKGNKYRRAKVVEQTTSYATFLAQETRSDVAAYSFDDQNGLIALQSFGVFEYEKVKYRDPRGKDATTIKFTKNKKRVPKKKPKSGKRKMQRKNPPKKK